MSSSGGLVESYRFDSVRNAFVPDSYSVLPTVTSTGAVFVDQRHQRVFHITAPTVAGTSTLTPYEMQPITGLVTQGSAFSITGQLIAAHPNGRFLLTREPPDNANPSQSRLHALPIDSSLQPGNPITTQQPANVSVVFSPDGGHAYLVDGTATERPQGIVGQIIIRRCDFDANAGAFGTCDPAVSIDTPAFGGQCPSNQVCNLDGYAGESLAVDPQMRLLYVTAVASLRFGGNITSNSETWAVQLGPDRKLIATAAQRLATTGSLLAEPNGRFLFIASPTKLESWAIDAGTLMLANISGANGLGEPARVNGSLSVNCDDSGSACAVFSSAGLQHFSWSSATATYVASTPMPVAADNVDVWLATGPDPLRIWPQDVYVGSNDESRVDIIRFDLLGAVQSRSTQSLVPLNSPAQTAETLSQDPSGALCVPGRPSPLSNDLPNAQRFLISSGTGTLSQSPVLPTRGGQVAIARDPGRNGNYEVVSNGVRLSTASDCGGLTSIVAPVPGIVPRHIAVDPLGRRVYVMSMVDARVTMFPINRAAAAAGIALPFGMPQTVSTVAPSGLLIVTDMAIDERGERLFATIGNRDQLLIMDIDAATGLPVVPAQVRSTGTWPAAVAISPDNSNLYVLNGTGRSISRFGAAPGFVATGTTPLPTIPGTPNAASSEPRFGFEVAITGQLLYVSDHDADQFQLWGVNETDGSLTLRTPVAMPAAGVLWAVNRRF